MPGRMAAPSTDENSRSGPSARGRGRLGTVRPGGYADPVARGVGENPDRRRLAVIDDASTGGQGCRQPFLGALFCDGHVDVHRVPEGLVLGQLLHPERRPVAEWVDTVVVVGLGVPEHRTPEADVDLLRA